MWRLLLGFTPAYAYLILTCSLYVVTGVPPTIDANLVSKLIDVTGVLIGFGGVVFGVLFANLGTAIRNRTKLPNEAITSPVLMFASFAAVLGLSFAHLSYIAFIGSSPIRSISLVLIELAMMSLGIYAIAQMLSAFFKVHMATTRPK